MRHYRCSVPGCKLKYSTPYTLKRHVQAFHLQIKRFSCPICGRLFAYKHTMLDHKVRHRNIREGVRSEIEVPKLTEMLKLIPAVTVISAKIEVDGPILPNIEEGRQEKNPIPWV